MTKIYLLRHAHYDNLENIIPGRLPISISEKGIQQSKRLQAFFEDKNIETIYCSPVKRCLETAKIISGETLPLVIDDRLAETLTASEGRPKQELWRHQLYAPVPNRQSETPEHVQQRIVDFWNSASFHPEKNYLVCSHGDPLFFLFQYLEGQTIHTDLNVNKPLGYPPKGSVRLFEKNGEKVVVTEVVEF